MGKHKRFMLKNFSIPEDWENIQLVSNYHAHNYLCGHAGGTVLDYVGEAVAHGMKIIGISDHCLPPIATYDPYFSAKNIDKQYLPQFDEAEELYGDKIKILRGVEIEYFAGYPDYYKRLTDMLDYMVLGQHLFMWDGQMYNSFVDGTDDKSVAAYFDSVCDAIDSGLFAMVAHPDLIFYRLNKMTEYMVGAMEQVVKLAADKKIPLELNSNGMRYHRNKYPTQQLVDLCLKHNARVVVSSDAHSPDSLCDMYMRALYAYAKNIGLNVVDEII
ncbi:MAG: histidinol-phosphatase [Clostridiales bacterium]|nr:histidinol-phosphatase [Clostridiales bacterium]